MSINMDNQQYDEPPNDSDYLETVDQQSSDNEEYAIYGATAEYLASEMKKHKAEIERLAARSNNSVFKDKIHYSVTYL